MEVPSHERLSARELFRKNPPRLDLLYKLTPLRVGRDAILAGKDGRGASFPRAFALLSRLKREKQNKIVIIIGENHH